MMNTKIWHGVIPMLLSFGLASATNSIHNGTEKSHGNHQSPKQEKHLSSAPADSAVQQLNTAVITTGLPLGESMHEIHGKQLFQKTKENLANSLEQELNFSKRSLGPAPARPVVRGLGGDHIQIAQNGNKVSDLSGTSPDHAVSLSPAQFKSIFLLQGLELIPFNLSLLGARIEVDRGLFLSPAREQINWRVNSSLFSATPGGNVGAQLEIPYSQFTSRVQLSGSSLGNTRSTMGELPNTSAKQWEAAAGVQHDGERSRMGADYAHFSMDYGIPGGFIGGHGEGVNIALERTTANVGHVYTTSKDSIRSTVSVNSFHQLETEVNGPVGAEFFVQEVWAHSAWARRTSSLMDYQAGVAIGLEHREYGGFVYTPFTNRVSAALWSVARMKPRVLVPVSVGVRVQASKDELSGLYAMRHNTPIDQREFVAHSVYLETAKMYSDWNYKLGVFQTSRIPTVEELYSQGPHLAAYSYDKGNAALQKEMGYGSKLTMQAQLRTWEFSAVSFYTWFSDFVRTRPSGKINWATQLPEYLVQDGEAMLWGAALAVQSSEWNHLSVRLAGDYTWGKDLYLQEPLPAISPMRLQSALLYHTANHEFGLRSVYYYKQSRVSQFETPTESNLILHCDYTFQKALRAGLLRLQAGVENIMNQTYKNHLSRIKEVFPEPGRSVFFKVQFSS
jgi:iron complex outermembrane recepter protein